MRRYAKQTRVPASRTREEIARTLERYGADQFVYAENKKCGQVGFVYNNKSIRFDVEFPPLPDSGLQADENRRQQEIRSIWRAVLLVLKAKLEAIETGITTFEEEFLAHILLPDGRTVGATVLPRVEETLIGHQVPLLGPGTKGEGDA